MRFCPQNQNDRTGAFDIELEGFGRIAHVDPFGADDPIAFRDLICAAPDMLAALKVGECPVWVHNAALTNDIEALRAIALWFANWNNDVRLPAIAKAEGRP